MHDDARAFSLSRAHEALLPAVDAVMHRLTRGEDRDPLGAICDEHLASGGKRIRARLALTAAAALGGEAEGAVPWAAACELLHNATLIHDDVQDGDRVRRGHPTVWARHGQAQAINAGDLMLMLPYAAALEVEAPAEAKLALVDALTRHASTTVRGQAIELELLREGASPDVLKQAYLRGIQGKTSALFELPVEGGALLAGKTRAEAREIASPFHTLGMLFQFQDDVLDLYGEKGREAPGSDLREGKVSSLVVEHLALAPGDRDWLVGVLRTPRDETRAEDVEQAIARFQMSGALDAVVDEMKRIASALTGSDRLRGVPVLHQVATEFLDVILRPIGHVLERAPAR